MNKWQMAGTEWQEKKAFTSFDIKAPPSLFNQKLYRARLEKLDPIKEELPPLHDYVHTILKERLSFVRRTFKRILLLGRCYGPALLPEQSLDKDYHIFHLTQGPEQGLASFFPEGRYCEIRGEEGFLPFSSGKFDLAISYWQLHHLDDIPGLLRQLCDLLEPDGLFLGTFLGGESLWELRTSCMRSQEAVCRGINPMVAPTISVAESGRLLQRAGFSLPVVDHDALTWTYQDPLAYFKDLKSMGLTNILWDQRKGMMSPELFTAILEDYHHHYGQEEGVSCTYDVIYLSGWAPCKKQPQSLRPGSGEVSLKKLLS